MAPPAIYRRAWTMVAVPPDPASPQLVATLGPASLELAPDLAAAGATSFRLNASHLSVSGLVQAFERVRGELPGCSVVVDLQGAKMRLGELGERTVQAGERVRLVLDAGAGPARDGVPLPHARDGVPLPHPELFDAVEPGETLSNDDDRLRLRVEEVGEGDMVVTCLVDGRLRPRTGVNVLEHPVHLSDLTEVDDAKVRALAAHHDSRLAFAFSFLSTEAQVEQLRRRAPACPVVGKIERREATENVRALERAVDTVWICRGDLGAQLGPAAMARFVGGYDPRATTRPVLMAGQVLEHLTRHAQPTRSEVCHLHDLLARGYAGLVLSDETAIGDDPVRAVSTAATLLRALG